MFGQKIWGRAFYQNAKKRFEVRVVSVELQTFWTQLEQFIRSVNCIPFVVPIVA